MSLFTGHNSAEQQLFIQLNVSPEARLAAGAVADAEPKDTVSARPCRYQGLREALLRRKDGRRSPCRRSSLRPKVLAKGFKHSNAVFHLLSASTLCCVSRVKSAKGGGW